MNKFIGIGNLAKDPEMRYSPNGTAVTTFTLAINRPKRNGEDQGADFLNVVTLGKLAENCAQYLSKGRPAAVEGRMQTRSYEKDGQKRFVTEVFGENVQFLGGGQREERQGKSGDPFNDPFADVGKPINISTDDLPF